jgi:uncharacterized small protein (DUF1192 family)
MTQELTQQWLAEIQALKEQVVTLQTERDAGWASAEKWRKLYNTEAEQRRTDAQMAQQTIASLKVEIEKIKGIEEARLNDSTIDQSLENTFSHITSVDELKTKLIALTKECHRLQQALKIEQENHAQTRKSLTTALGDAIDGLKKEREVEEQGEQGEQGE